MTLSNADMLPNRYGKLAKGRKLMARMNKCWDAGGFVRIGTATRYTDYKPAHRTLIQVGKSGSLYQQRGKKHECIDFCSFSFSA